MARYYYKACGFSEGLACAWLVLRLEGSDVRMVRATENSGHPWRYACAWLTSTLPEDEMPGGPRSLWVEALHLSPSIKEFIDTLRPPSGARRL